MIEGIKRGDVYMVNLSGGKVGSEQDGLRPVVVTQNNVGNKFSPTIIVAAITSQSKKIMPTHVTLSVEQYNLVKPSMILTEQIITIDKQRIIGDKLFSLNDMDMIRLDRAIQISMGLVPTRPTTNIKMNKRVDVVAI